MDRSCYQYRLESTRLSASCWIIKLLPCTRTQVELPGILVCL